MPLWNKFNAFESTCSSKIGLILAIKNDSKFFLVVVLLGADSNKPQLKIYPKFKKRYFDGSDFLLMLWNSA